MYYTIGIFLSFFPDRCHNPILHGFPFSPQLCLYCSTDEHTVSPMWGRPFEALCMFGRWGGGFYIGPRCVYALLWGLLFFSLSSMVVIVGGSSADVIFYEWSKPWDCQWGYTPVVYPNIKDVPWINWRDKCGHFDIVCASCE